MAYGAAARAAPPPSRAPPTLCRAGAAAAVLVGAACLVAALAVRAPTSLDAVLTAKMTPADVRVGWRDDHEEDEPAQQPGRSEPQAQPTALLAVETGKFSVRNTLSNMSDPSLDLDSYDDRTRLPDTQKRESESEKEREKIEWRRIRGEKGTLLKAELPANKLPANKLPANKLPANQHIIFDTGYNTLMKLTSAVFDDSGSCKAASSQLRKFVSAPTMSPTEALTLLRGKPLLFLGDSQVLGTFASCCTFLGGKTEKIPGNIPGSCAASMVMRNHVDIQCRLAGSLGVEVSFQWNVYGEFPESRTERDQPSSDMYQAVDHTETNKALKKAKVIVMGTGLWSVTNNRECQMNVGALQPLPFDGRDPLSEMAKFVDDHKRRPGEKPLVILRSPISLGLADTRPQWAPGETYTTVNQKLMKISKAMERMAKDAPDPRLRFIDTFTPTFDTKLGRRSECPLVANSEDACKCHFALAKNATGWTLTTQQVLRTIAGSE